MRSLTELLDFLEKTMSMTDIYQPVVILHLLERGGSSTRSDLARTLSGYDEAVQEYYEKVLMRWPKITLQRHGIIRYERRKSMFVLNFDLKDAGLVEKAKQLCEQKTQEWIEKKRARGSHSRTDASVRYRVLKAARGKCELCGISAKIVPIDIDHIIPRSKADRHGYVLKDNVKMHVDDERNLQALCIRCNRAKRDQDATDWRLPSQRQIREARTGYSFNFSSGPASASEEKQLEGLFDRLVEEHVRLIDQDSKESLRDRVADMINLLVAIASFEGATEQDVFNLVQSRRKTDRDLESDNPVVQKKEAAT